MATVKNLVFSVKDKVYLYLTKNIDNYDYDYLLKGELGKCISKIDQFSVSTNAEKTTFDWPEYGKLTVQCKELATGERYDLEWELAPSQHHQQTINDSYAITGAHWYGAAQVRKQTWPIEQWQRPTTPYVCGDSFVDQYGGVQERYWLSSKGVALFVEEDVPLFVGMNEHGNQLLNFEAKFEKPYKNVSGRNLYFKFSIYHGADVKRVHKMVSDDRIPRPIAIPDETMFKYPIWSTWARYKKAINEQKVLELGREVLDNGFKSCQIEIDDDWTPSYGDYLFHSGKFPTPKAMVEQLKAMGHRVTLWVHPFASPFSKTSYKGILHHFLSDFQNGTIRRCTATLAVKTGMAHHGINTYDSVPEKKPLTEKVPLYVAAPHGSWVKSGKLPGICKWWNGVGRHIDVTNSEACEWFKENLKYLQDRYGVTSFKFDAGEVNWLPPYFKLHRDCQNPNVFTKRYAELAHSIDPDVRCQEVRVGWRTQHLPIFVRMMDKDSNWTYDNGLQSLIPHALTFSLLGYHFCLPDMIGGNAYKAEYPDKELFIRWMQANVFLPAIQFSIVPWQYEDPQVVEICKKMCALHEQYSDLMIQLAKESVTSGEPIIRPLWWISPDDETSLVLDSEFLVGDAILVAPVLECKATSRDIYFPVGRWKDENTGVVFDGPKWVRKYKAGLDVLPYFSRVSTDHIHVVRNDDDNIQVNVENTNGQSDERTVESNHDNEDSEGSEELL